MNYWLMKSEPNAFSINDLLEKENQTTHWDGVRNYQARNMLRDQIKKGDLAFFYHSNSDPSGIAGIVEVVQEGYPDFTAFDSKNHHYDPKSTPERPVWFMVDVKLVRKFDRIISLSELKANSQLENMMVVRKGNRLSISPVSKNDWETILKMEKRS
ncbi:MAG: EVE domain-containing protein [Gammaproteobacteria bacterium]